MTVVEGSRTYDEGPTSGDIPLKTVRGAGHVPSHGLLSAILPGVDEPTQARQPEYWTSDNFFPGPIAVGGMQAGQVAFHAAALRFDSVVTRAGLTASQNDTQYLTAWDTAGDMIGQVTWEPDADSAFTRSAIWRRTSVRQREDPLWPSLAWVRLASEMSDATRICPIINDEFEERLASGDRCLRNGDRRRVACES